ncbi:MAG: DUF4326 domain-containing protein, partial [Rhodobacteraceae bacterium]|nr:DUF4326 domain-containing protein [Paracoccaceae bacterium]
RPSRWGNPFTIKAAREAGSTPTNRWLKSCFEWWLNGDRANWMGEESDQACEKINSDIDQLKGKNLACWCPLDAPCHADVLLELANK